MSVVAADLCDKFVAILESEVHEYAESYTRQKAGNDSESSLAEGKVIPVTVVEAGPCRDRPG